METTQTRIASAFKTLQPEFGYKNVMQSPKIEKVVISIGTGRVQDKAKIALIKDRLALITGQKASPRAAKQSIASFKLREGDIVGYQVTLRGKRMIHFVDKLIHLALPQTRDFRGLKVTAIDEMGNYTLGIKEHTIFPECGDEEIKDVFSFAVTIVTTASDKKESEAFLRHIGFPLQKSE
jgi:large subunit ribosomal protein L5